MSKQLDSLKREFLLEAAEDYVGLWEFPSSIRRHLSIEDPEEIKRVSMELIRQFVNEGIFAPGELAGEGGFDAWSLSPSESIETIGKLWERLGREPNLGDEAPWFNLTKKGERVAQESKTRGPEIR